MVWKMGPCGNSPVEPIEWGVPIDEFYGWRVVGGRHADDQKMCQRMRIRKRIVSTRGKPVPGCDLEEI